VTRVDTSASRYSESPTAREEFARDELRHCRTLLRRLHFLESKVEESGGIAAPGGSGGAAWAEWESAGLEWILKDAGFLIVKEVSRNPDKHDTQQDTQRE
jgi:hypothetical protein